MNEIRYKDKTTGEVKYRNSTSKDTFLALLPLLLAVTVIAVMLIKYL